MLHLQLGVPCLNSKNTAVNLMISRTIERSTNKIYEKMPRMNTGRRMRMMFNQNTDSEDKKADMDMSGPTPGTDFPEQSKENGSFEKAVKSDCTNAESASRFSWSKICSPAGYC